MWELPASDALIAVGLLGCVILLNFVAILAVKRKIIGGTNHWRTRLVALLLAVVATTLMFPTINQAFPPARMALVYVVGDRAGAAPAES